MAEPSVSDHQCVASKVADRLAHPTVRIDQRSPSLLQVVAEFNYARGISTVFVCDQNVVLGLENLKRIRHISDAGNSTLVTFRFWIGEILGPVFDHERIRMQPFRAVTIPLGECFRLVGDRSSLHPTETARLGQISTDEIGVGCGCGPMFLDVPIRGIHGLPDAAQVRLTVCRSRCFVSAVSLRIHGAKSAPYQSNGYERSDCRRSAPRRESIATE